MLEVICYKIVNTSDVWVPIFFLALCYALTLFCWYCITMSSKEDDDGMMRAGGLTYGWMFAGLTLVFASWEGSENLGLHWISATIIGALIIIAGCFLVSAYRERIRLI